MHTMRTDRAAPDRVARSLVALAIVAAHLLLIYVLAVSRGVITTPLQDGGEAMVLVMPGDTRQSGIAPAPPEIQPQMIEPADYWASRIPDFMIEEPFESAPSSAPQAAAAGPGRPDMPGTSAEAAGIAVLQRVLPIYPTDSMRAGEEGGAILQVLVDERGLASDVKVARSTGFERLDDAAVRAVRQWKFAPATRGVMPVAAWGEMELRFNLYRFTISRILDAPLDLLPPGRIQAGANEAPIPGSEAALRRLIEDLLAAVASDPNATWPAGEVKRIQEALAGWGEARGMQFRGAVAGNLWRTYEVKPEYRRGNRSRETVELRWDMFEVWHEHGRSEWRIAVDRNGTIWCAHAGSAAPREQRR